MSPFAQSKCPDRLDECPLSGEADIAAKCLPGFPKPIFAGDIDTSRKYV